MMETSIIQPPFHKMLVHNIRVPLIIIHLSHNICTVHALYTENNCMALNVMSRTTYSL